MKKKLKGTLKISDLHLVESIIDIIPAHIYWEDTNGILLGCNNLMAHTVGVKSKAELIGKPSADYIPKDKYDAIQNINQKVIETGNSYTVEEITDLQDKKEVAFLTTKKPLWDEHNNIIGIIGISVDITEKKLNEELKKKNEIMSKQVELMKFTSTAIAHELRTPLASLKIAGENLTSFFPALLNGYQQAANENLNLNKIPASAMPLIANIPHTIEKETRFANTFIDILLMNVNPNIEAVKNEHFDISLCVAQAIERYPMTDQQRKLIRVNNDKHFNVYGKKLLVTHILFNLLKNALYYVAKARKGNIEICFEQGKKYNKLYFKDTGAGIAKKDLPHIFKHFYSKTKHGTGVGLAFSKMAMEAMSGDIICESVEGEYTEFILLFV